jgi:DNA-nicking Smr family endonuclease
MSFYTPQSRDEDFDEVIDLHGYTSSDTRTLIDDLIRERAGKVRLLVGKGTRSEYIEVIPNVVRNYLQEKRIQFEEVKDGAIDAKF